MAVSESPLATSCGSEGTHPQAPADVKIASGEKSTDLSESASPEDHAVRHTSSDENVHGINPAAKQEDHPDLPHTKQPILQPCKDQNIENTQSSGESGPHRAIAKKEPNSANKDVHGNVTDAVHYLEALEKRLRDLEDKVRKPQDKPAEGDE